jgi:hypothetical protein
MSESQKKPRSSVTSRKHVLLVLLLIASTLLLAAWQTAVTYGHWNRYGGEAESGYHRGQVELSGGNRYVRAGDDYVYWTSSQVAWINANIGSRKPAMVYHAFAPNTNSCGGIRIHDMSWSWSNLPSVSYVSKRVGCLSGNHNEWRAVMGTAPTAGSYYWFQHLFRDMNYPSSNSTGEITVDSYWHYSCWPTYCSDYKDYHGKFCVNTTNTAYSPVGGSC